MTKHISNHPFIFLTSLVLVASCCLGGFLAVAQAGRELVEATVTAPVLATVTMIAPAPATETATISLPTITRVTPSVGLVIPTSTNTAIPEETATNQPATPFPTLGATVTRSTNPLVVHFIDVGQGDSILIESPDGLTMLIDGGSANTGVVPYLRGQGIERIDLMVATHPHEDHIGGLIQVLVAMPVTRVVTNGQPHTTATYEHFLDAILNSQAEYSEVKRGDTIALGELKFSVLNPGGILGDDLNENSVVLRLVYSQTTLLFMGDAGFIAEGSMLGAGMPLKANILKVGHHGSCSATSSSFLQAVQPEVGIYSAGINNQYGHPCANTINTLNQRGVFVLGTDVNGSIIATVTEVGYRITDAAGRVLRR